MGLDLAVLPGDGAGPSVATQALNVVQAVGERFDQSFNFNVGPIDGVAMDAPGKALNRETLYTVIEYAKARLERRRTSNVPGPDLRGE